MLPLDTLGVPGDNAPNKFPVTADGPPNKLAVAVGDPPNEFTVTVDDPPSRLVLVCSVGKREEEEEEEGEGEKKREVGGSVEGAVGAPLNSDRVPLCVPDESCNEYRQFIVIQSYKYIYKYKVGLRACNNLLQPPPYILVFGGCGRLLSTLPCNAFIPTSYVYFRFLHIQRCPFSECPLLKVPLYTHKEAYQSSNVACTNFQ